MCFGNFLHILETSIATWNNFFSIHREVNFPEEKLCPANTRGFVVQISISLTVFDVMPELTGASVI